MKTRVLNALSALAAIAQFSQPAAVPSPNLFRLPRTRYAGGSNRKGKWAEYAGCPKDKFATITRQRRRRAGFTARVNELNAKHGFNLSRQVRRRIAWDSWRDGMVWNG